MFSKPLVSVIVPLFNSERYITASIESIINQTYPEIEVIIINDGSTDHSLEIVEKFRKKEIKIFSQSNKGASAARNFGLRAAKGDYIQFLDADDLLSPTKIEDQVRLLSENQEKIAICPTIHFIDSENMVNDFIDEWYYASFENPADFLIRLYGGYSSDGGMIQPNSWLTPRKIIDKAGFWNEELSVDDDGEFFCRVILASQGIVFSGNAINYYRKYRENKGLSAKSDYKASLSAYKALVLKQQHFINFENEVAYKKAFARAYKRLAIQTYPQFKEISTNCIKNLRLLGGSDHRVILGGWPIEIIKKFLGWKIARLMQYFYRHT